MAYTSLVINLWWRATGWTLDIKTRDSSNRKVQYNSYAGKQQLPDDHPLATVGAVNHWLQASDDYPYEPARRMPFQNALALIEPENWDRIQLGCHNRSQATLEWLELYLGIKAELVQGSDLTETRDLNIPV